MITSTNNPRVKTLAQLKKAGVRRERKVFLIEGEREVARAIAAEIELELLVICPELLPSEATSSPGVEILEVAAAPMGRITMRENPPGVVAVARMFDTSLANLALGTSPLVLIAEHVEKPGNLGAMMRSCDGAGADAMIVTDPATDVFNPNVVRASQGALFSVRIAVADPGDVIAWCQRNTIRVLGGYPVASTQFWDADLTGPTALLVGAEDAGISPAWEGTAHPVGIPMAGDADSLNASVSAAILLYEAVRQRRR